MFIKDCTICILYPAAVTQNFPCGIKVFIILRLYFLTPAATPDDLSLVQNPHLTEDLKGINDRAQRVTVPVKKYLVHSNLIHLSFTVRPVGGNSFAPKQEFSDS